MSANQFNQPIGNPAGPAYEQMPDAGTGLRESAHQAGEQLKQKTQETADQLKQKGTETLQEARQQAEALAARQKGRLLDTLSHCSNASRRAADSLREDDDSTMAGYAEALAGQIERSTEYLRQRDYKSMLRDTEDLARRHPELFFGGMLVTGLALARFFKASSSRKQWEGDTSAGAMEYPRPAFMEYEEASTTGLPASQSSTPIGAPSVAANPGTQFTG